MTRKFKHFFPPRHPVYVVSTEFFDQSAEEVSVMRGEIAYTEEPKRTMMVKLSESEIYPVVVQNKDALLFPMGYILNQDEEVVQIVFPDELSVWKCREWFILSNAICRAHYEGASYCEVPNNKNLAYCRMVYDIIAGQEPAYQAMSCDGCVHAGKKDSSGRIACHGCIRCGWFQDRWEGASNQAPPPRQAVQENVMENRKGDSI